MRCYVANMFDLCVVDGCVQICRSKLVFTTWSLQGIVQPIKEEKQDKFIHNAVKERLEAVRLFCCVFASESRALLHVFDRVLRVCAGGEGSAREAELADKRRDYTKRKGS